MGMQRCSIWSRDGALSNASGGASSQLMPAIGSLVDHHTSSTPKKRIITLPNLASIEEMRTPSSEKLTEEENISNNISKLGHPETKTQQQQLLDMAASPNIQKSFHICQLNRTPFADVI
ncbi:hypothetical protein QYF36_012071 [Acer negundo]|nr:hypothetical protein QYF36_012071 [Acer negundo]